MSSRQFSNLSKLRRPSPKFIDANSAMYAGNPLHYHVTKNGIQRKNVLSSNVCLLTFCALCTVFGTPFAVEAATSTKKPAGAVVPTRFFNSTYNSRTIRCGVYRNKAVAGRRVGRYLVPLTYNENLAKAALRGKKGSALARARKAYNAARAKRIGQYQACDGVINPLSGKTGPLTVREVKYLYRKAALGAWTDEAIQIGTTQGASALVDYMFTRKPDSDVLTAAENYLDENSTNGVSMNEMAPVATQRGIQLWATYIMLNTPNPALERLAFMMMHNYYATGDGGLSGDQEYLMWEHLNMVRSNLGSLRDFLKAGTRDPAMLVFLSGNQNRKGNENRNYGRELMELFSLGPVNATGEANYTEDDVINVARACTGWTLQDLNNGLWSSIFVTLSYDSDSKTIFPGTPYQLVVSGADNDFKVIDHILDNHPNAAKYVATRLLEEYVQQSPSQALIAQTATILKNNNYNITETLKTILKSSQFFAADKWNTIQAGPFERMIGFLRETGMPYDIFTLIPSASDSGLRGSGQYLGNHPTPFGYDNDKSFAGGAQSLSLIRLVESVFNNQGLFSQNSWTYDKLLPPIPAGGSAATARSAAQVVDYLSNLIGAEPNAAQRDKLIEFLNNRAVTQGGSYTLQANPWNPDYSTNANTINQKMGGLLEALFFMNGLR